MSDHLAKTILVLVLALVSAAGCSADPTSDEGATSTAPLEPPTTTSTITVAAETAPYVHPGSEELSGRQIEMLDVLERYGAAFKARDGDPIATFMTDDATVEYNEQGDIYLVADGSWQERVRLLARSAIAPGPAVASSSCGAWSSVAHWRRVQCEATHLPRTQLGRGNGAGSLSTIRPHP